tara:strand:+ start:36 stop:563 length:528 start_codon:yes stop_codon:yes gene_type:complete
MIDEIFSSPIRKYNIEDPLIKRWVLENYEEEKFNISAPFRLHITDFPANLSTEYTDVTEKLLDDLGMSETHVAIISDIILSVLEKGDSMDRCNTLPSHYTATHFISGNDADVFYHPARSLMTLFNPGLDEWGSATTLYVNTGDVIVHPSYLEYATPMVEQQRLTLTLLIHLQQRT